MKLEQLAELLGIPDLPSYVGKVERALEQALKTDTASLREPAFRLTKIGGKRLRPILVIAAAASGGAKISDEVTRASTAVELLHIGTVVHDDIIDDGDIRWGIPTINKQEGLSQAILVGDYLLAQSAKLATSISQEIGLIVADTIAVMCDGQSLETADEYNLDRSIDAYNETIHKKTAALVSAACRIGAICARLPKTDTESLVRFGESFGMAFQLIDDLLDIVSTPEAMGKPTGNDIKEGVYTFPVLAALQKPVGRKLRRSLKTPGDQAAQSAVVEILSRSGAFDETLLEIQKHITAAENALHDMERNAAVTGLSKLPAIYFQWAMQKQNLL